DRGLRLRAAAGRVGPGLADQPGRGRAVPGGARHRRSWQLSQSLGQQCPAVRQAGPGGRHLLLAVRGQWRRPGRHRWHLPLRLLHGSVRQTKKPPKVMSGKRGTQADWSADGRSIVYVQPGMFLAGGLFGGGDYDHFSGGSLYTMAYDPGNKTFGTPTSLLASG